MRNILHDLYNGCFNAFERRPIDTEEYRAVYHKIEDEKRCFIEKMPSDDFQRFEALESLYFRANDMEQADAFSYGFKLGAMLMFAVFFDESEPRFN